MMARFHFFSLPAIFLFLRPFRKQFCAHRRRIRDTMLQIAYPPSFPLNKNNDINVSILFAYMLIIWIARRVHPDRQSSVRAHVTDSALSGTDEEGREQRRQKKKTEMIQ